MRILGFDITRAPKVEFRFYAVFLVNVIGAGGPKRVEKEWVVSEDHIKTFSLSPDTHLKARVRDWMRCAGNTGCFIGDKFFPSHRITRVRVTTQKWERVEVPRGQTGA